jgi:GT2 family glycosyltransferase
MGQRDLGQFDRAESVEFASGCAMMITSQAIAKLQGFDERFFFGGEDRELSIRCKKAGFDVWYEPTAVIYHKRGEMRRRIPEPERLYMGYLTQLFYMKISRSKTRWFFWYGLYMLHFSTILPVRLFLNHGINLGSLNCIRATWSAWIEAFHADRAYPREIEKFSPEFLG